MIAIATNYSIANGSAISCLRHKSQNIKSVYILYIGSWVEPRETL